MTIYGRAYKTVAILVCLGMLISLLPAPLWWEIFGVKTAHAASSPAVATSPLTTADSQVNDLVASLGDALPPELAEQLGSLGALTPQGEPNGMLMDAAALQGLPASPPTQPAALANPISVSRVQSAYAASAAIANTLLVTFTVTNNRPPVNIPQIDPNASITDTIAAISNLDFANDPNVIRNVLLTDELLPPQATYVEATPRPDHQNNVYAWNLGDIPPLSSVTMTLKLTVPAGVLDFTELDTGAAAWGTLQGRAVTDSTAPITLAPDGYEGWLVCTIDANCQDEYVIEKAAELGNDPTAIFYYVRSLGFESYKGSLRGARGTLWSEAGNSTDQASLLIALLRASGIPAAYRHGDLEMPLRRQLILSMFPKPQGVIGHIPPGTEVADPANDPQLLDETRDHWWVQAYLPGLGWTHLDPTFTNAAIGNTFVPFPAPDQLPELPDTLRHKVTIKVKIEQYHPLNLGGSVSGLAESYPLAHVFNSVELVGKPVTLRHLINTESQGGLVFYWVRHTYLPYFVIGDSINSIEGTAFQTLTSNFPLGTFLVTGEWLIIEVHDLDGNIERFEREVVDKIGFEARQQGGAVTLAMNQDTATQPILNPVDQFVVVIASSQTPANFIAERSLQLQDAVIELEGVRAQIPSHEQHSANQEAFFRDAVNTLNEANQQLLSVLGESFYYASNFSRDRLNSYLVQSYFDAPQIVIASQQVIDSESLEFNHSMDLLKIVYRGLAFPGQAKKAESHMRLIGGLLDTALESEVMEVFATSEAISIPLIFARAEQLGIRSRAITSSNLEELNNLNLSVEAKARITNAARQGKTIIVPSEAVNVGGQVTIGWIEISSDGYAIGVGEDGLHQISVETAYLKASAWFGARGQTLSFLAGGIWAIYSFSAHFLALPFPIGDPLLQGMVAVIANVFGDLALQGAKASAILMLAAVAWSFIDLIRLCNFSGTFDAFLKGSHAALFCLGAGLVLEAIALIAIGLLFGTDPPLPKIHLQLIELAQIISSAKRVVYAGANHTGSSLSATLNSPLTNLRGTLRMYWKSSAQSTLQFVTLSSLNSLVYDSDYTLIDTGAVSVSAMPHGSMAIVSGSEVNYIVDGSGTVSFYSPAIASIAVSGKWTDYTAQLTSTLPFTMTLQNVEVTVNGTNTYYGSFTLIPYDATYLSGEGQTTIPNFTDLTSILADDAHLSFDTAVGIVEADDLLLDTTNGLSFLNYTGDITVTEATSMTDFIELNGNTSFFTLDLLPKSSVTSPNTPITFQSLISANFTDNYTMTVEAPNGWEVDIDNTGLITATPPFGTVPTEYPILIMAQSGSYSDAFASAIHSVVVTPVQGMGLDVTEEPLITVPWGPFSTNNLFSDTNDGRLQLPGAAFATSITNTSTVPHTFDVAVSGLPDGWLILSGAEGETETSITLPAGGVGQIGLYISPTVAALPPAGTEYPFTVTAVDTDGAGLSQTDSDTFTVPAIAFNQVTADPSLVFAAPGGMAEFDLSVRNVGNIAGSFPVTLTLPISTWVQVTPHTSPVIVGAGDVDHQAIALTIPPDAPLGRSYGVRVDSPAPGTAYVQTTFANVQIVSANALPIYQAAQEAAALFPEAVDLTAALNFLALSIDKLEQSCQAGNCDLTYRNRVASGAAALSQAAAPISPLMTTIAPLADLAVLIRTHTNQADLLADNVALRDLVGQLRSELQAIANHDLHGRFAPGIQTVLENAPAAYDLHLTNRGSLPTTAVLILTVTAANPGNTAVASWTTQSILLQPGETATVPTTITPSDQGAYLVRAQLAAAEASLIRQEIPTALHAVDALLILGGVNPVPGFVELGTGTDVAVHITLANVANSPMSGNAWVQLHAPDGDQVYSQTVPIAVSSSIVPLSYNLGNVETAGLPGGVYTVTVQILDTAGAVIPKATGQGVLGVGQAVEADIQVAPEVVTPGDTAVTVTIDTRLSQSVLSLAAQIFEMVKRVVMSRAPNPDVSKESLAVPALTLPAAQLNPPGNTPGGAPQIIYRNNFESSVGPEWSVAITDTTPHGYNFLGQFITETATLSLDNLPPHGNVTVSFDLFIIGSWDGVHPLHGPDIFDLSLVDGPTLLHTTFAAWDNNDPDWWQNYPESYPDGDVYYPGTGTDYYLGYYHGFAYDLSFTFPHTGTDLALIFAGLNLTDELWGIDNVVVSVDTGPLPVCGPDIGGNWQTAVPLPLPLSTPFEYAGNELIFHNGRVYIFGGKNADEHQRTDIYASDINPDGSLAGWNLVGQFPQPYIDYNLLQANGFVYLLTGADGQWDVWFARLDDLGQPDPWQPTTHIPGSRQGFGAAIYNNYLYIGGGGDLVQYVAIDPITGELGAWQEGVYLPQPEFDNMIAIHDGTLYVFGHGGTIYYAPLADDGRIGGWIRLNGVIPFDAHRHTTFISNGYLYVVGGMNNLNSDVFYAPLRPNGSVGPWQTTRLPLPIGDHRDGMWGGIHDCTVYAIGGHYPHHLDETAYFDTVYYAHLQPHTLPPHILLVDDDDWSDTYRDAYTTALASIGARYDLWDVQASGEPTSSTLAAYDTVIWFTGEATADVGPSAGAEETLATWLADGDRSLFISSRAYHADQGLTDFMLDHLGVLTVTDSVDYLTVHATGPLSSFGSYDLLLPLADDNAVITGTYETFFYTEDAAYQDVAVAYAGDGYRTTYWGFPFEALNSADDAEIMRATLNWLADDIRYAGPTSADDSYANLHGGPYVTANVELVRLTAVMVDAEGYPVRHRAYEIQIETNGGTIESVGTAVTDRNGELYFSFYLPDAYLDSSIPWISVSIYDPLYDVTINPNEGGVYLTPGELDIAASTLISLETPVVINEYGQDNYPNIELQLFLDSGLPYSGDYNGVALIFAGYDQYGNYMTRDYYGYPGANGYIQFGEYDTHWPHPGYVDVYLRAESWWYDYPVEWYLGQIEYLVGSIDYAADADADPIVLLADGIATTTVTATLYDYYGNFIPHRQVEVWVEGDYGDSYVGDAVSDEYGQMIFSFAWPEVDWLGVFIVDPAYNDYNDRHYLYLPQGISFVAGPVDPAHPQNIIAFYPNPAHANEDEIIVDAELYTVSGHPAADYYIELYVNGFYVTDNYLDEYGRGSFYFYWDTAGLFDLELYDPENGLFIPVGTIEILPGRIDPFASEVAASPPTIDADGVAQSVITATLRDYSGNLINERDIRLIMEGDVTGRYELDTVTSDADGRVTFPPFSSHVAEIFTIVLYDTVFNEEVYTAVTLTLVGPGPADENQSDFSIDPPQVVADGVTTAVISATLRDEAGRLITDRLIDLQLDGLTTQSATTDAQGWVSFDLTSTEVETIAVALHDTIYHVTVPVGVVEFVVGPVSAAASQLVADVTTLTADGVDEALLTVTLYDDYAHLLPGTPVTITASESVSLTQFSAVTDDQGIVTATVRGTAVQSVIITAVADDVTLDDTVTLQFIPGPASLAHSDITFTPAEVIANGLMNTTVDAILRDALGHVITDRPVTVQISGSDNIVSSLPTSTDADGRFTFTLASTAVELKTIAVYEPLYDATLELGTVNFVPGPTDPANSTVEVAPLVVVADGVQTAVITATLQDSLGHPAAGRTAELLVDDVVVQTNSADANGVVVFALTSTSLGTRQTAVRDAQYDVTLPGNAVIFVAGPADPTLSTISVTPNPVFAGGYQTATITVTIRDALNHPAAGRDIQLVVSGSGNTITPADTGITDETGTAVFFLTSEVAETKDVYAIDLPNSVMLPVQTVTFIPGPAVPANSSVQIAPLEVVADGVQTAVITATLRDILNQPITGRLVQLVVSGSGNTIAPSVSITPDANGVAVFTLASTIVEVKTIAVRDVAFDVTIPAASTVSFVPGPPDAATSQLSSSATTLVANGVSSATLTATLRDALGHPIPNRTVVINSTGSVTLTPLSTVTNAQGQVQATIRSTQAQVVTISATDSVSGVTFNQTVALTFVPGPAVAANSSVTAAPLSATANGEDAVTVTAVLRDAFNNPLANQPITLLVSGSNNSISPANTVNANASGTAVFTLTSTRAEIKQFDARDVTGNVTIPGQQVIFVHGPLAIGPSSLSVNVASAPADGLTPITVTVTARDAFNNPIPGLSVNLLAAGGPVTINQPTAVTGADGRTTGSVSAVQYGTITLQAVVGGQLLDDLVMVTFHGPDLILSKSGPANGVTGHEVTYTLSLQNSGPVMAQNVVATDILPAEISFLRATGPVSPTVTDNTVVWQLGDMAAGTAVQLTLVGRLSINASLGALLTNSATVATDTPEANLSNNTAVTTLTVVPGYSYSLSVEPAAATFSLGEAGVIDVMVTNTGHKQDTYDLSVLLDGIAPADYSLAAGQLTLEPGEIGHVDLTIQVDNCSLAGTYDLFALAASAGLGNTRTANGQITLVSSPQISHLLPGNGMSIGATSALFTWRTAVNSSGALFIRQVGQPTYTEYTSPPGTMHSITVTGLSRNTDYEWYVRNTSACGLETSEVRTLRVLNGIVFTNRTVNLTVERDYDQRRTITIQNQDTISHTVVLTIENPYPELIIGFVGNGSIDNPVILQPNQSLNLTLAMHTQDVTLFDYDLVARLTSNDGGDAIQDAIPVQLHVHVPNVELVLTEIGSDPITLVKQYRLTNLGDPLTDIAITSNLTGTGTVYLSPSMSHGYLQTGQSFEFEAIPVLEPGFVGVSGSIAASAAGETTELPISLDLPSGYAIYLGEANNMSMEASAGDWYCTNRPVINNRITLPAGFRHEDVVSAQFRFLASPRPDARPHDVSIYVNNEPIGSLTNIIPRGLYTFPIDPTFLNEADGRPSVNYIRLVTRHMNGGHYVVANNMLISICLSSYREWVAAVSQSQADEIVSGRSYLIPPPGVLDATILTPGDSQTLYAGVPTNITVQVADDIGRPWAYAVTLQADNGNGGVILFDDGFHGDGAARDGIYGGSWTPVNPGPTTLTVEAASCSVAGNHQITVLVETLDHAVAVEHTVPITGTSITNFTPVPQTVLTTTGQTGLVWDYTLNGVVPNQQLNLELQLEDMQAGEMRQISSGTVVSYTGVGGSGVIHLPPLFVAAPHLVAIDPPTHVTNSGGDVTYHVTLHNPGTTPLTLTPHISGLPASWVRFADEVTLNAGAQSTLPLVITVPPHTASDTMAFAVIVETASGGQDQASAVLTVADMLDIAVSPATAVAQNGEMVSYTVTITNPMPTAQVVNLAVTGLDNSVVELANVVSIAANSSETRLLRVTAYESQGTHALAVRGAVVGSNANASAPAMLTVLGDYHVQAALTPPVVVGGRNTPLPYTLTVRNAGNLADVYAISASVPAGWQYEFSANGTAVTQLGLTPFVFNEADLLLIVTPSFTAVPGSYPIAITVQSQNNPHVRAVVNGTATVTQYGVLVQITPGTTTLNPADTGSWNIQVTNLGSVADTYNLLAGGIVAGSAQFSQNSVSLAPGQSQTVQMTAGDMAFALVRQYPVEVTATSLFDSRVRGVDTAVVNFSGYEAVAVDWLPINQVLTDTNTATFMMLITNTGNVSTLYDLSVQTPGLAAELETSQVYIPPHMTAGILLTVIADTAGSYLITGSAHSASSSASDSRSATLIVDDGAVQHPPFAVNDVATTNEDSPVTVNVLANDTDPDGDALTVTAVSLPGHGTAVINVNNTITYMPATNYHGTDSFTYTISDGHGGAATATVTITILPVNDPPVAVDDEAITDEDVPVVIDVLANDSDVDGDVLSVSSLTQPGHGVAVINPDGTVTYTPDPDFNSGDSATGVDSFTYTVSDGHGAIAVATVTVIVVPVNDAPTAVNDIAITNEDTAVTIAVLANDSDVDGDPLYLEAVTAPASGTAVINPDGSVTYTPDANWHGLDSFTYTVSDGQGGVSQATVSVTVLPVNDAPTAVNDAATTDEDTAVTIAVLANDSDVDGDMLLVTAVSSPAYGVVVINADQTVTYTPLLNFNGADSFTYTIDDGQGATATATVVVTVLPVNDAPVAVDDAIATNMETAVTIPVLANDYDVDGDTVTVTSVTLPGHGVAVVNPDGSVTYTPNTGFYGVDSFHYTISDGQGGVATAAVIVTVTGGNQNPVAVDDVAVTDEDTAVTIDVLANDSDVNGDTLTVSSVSAPAHGTAVVNPDNAVTYTPHPNYHGPDSFSYTISDGQGGAATAWVTITVMPVNDPPLAVADTASTNEDTPITLDVLANDSDMDGDMLMITAVTTPTHGTAVINPDNTITYAPDADYYGPDSFSYTISDGQGGVATALVSLTILPVNDPPLAVHDTAMTDEDTAVTIDVLANDSDVDGDPLTVVSITQPTYGVAVLNPDGTVTYTPDADYNGADYFTYLISDGQGGVASAGVTIAINPVNDPPVAVDDQASTPEDTAVTVNVLANDSDVDGDLLVVTSVTTPTWGAVTVNPDNSITYLPQANFHGEDTFSYTISDGHNAMATAVVTITVTPVNDVPVAHDDAVVTGLNTAVTIAVLANDVDVDGDLLVVTAVTVPANGTAVINPDGSVTYTPAAGFTGVDSFTYTISDGNGGTDSATVTVTVVGGNHNPQAVDDMVITDEDTVTVIYVLANDSDADGDPLTIISVTPPTRGTVVINPDNTVTYTPNLNYRGLDSFTYTISDGRGGTDTAVVTIFVKNVNDPPVAVDDTAVTNRDTAVTIPVLANDSDVDNDVLSVAAVSQPAHGVVVINPDNTVTYTPNAGFDGVDTFTYTVSDGKGGTAVGNVIVDVLPVAAGCNLYPIALSADTLIGAQPGDVLPDIWNGSQPGNFGWLTWTGDTGVPALVASLTPPGNSHTYVNPYNTSDHFVSPGDWVRGKPGVSNALKIRQALDMLMSIDIVVPVWDQTQGNGANTMYRTATFATVRILGYDLPGQDIITVQFLGYAACGDN